MNEQPEALRLADLLNTNFWDGKCGLAEREEAAAELRRLHEVNQGLLEALKAIVEYSHDWETHPHDLRDIARVAIARTRGETK